jgi:hypothetical protein
MLACFPEHVHVQIAPILDPAFVVLDVARATAEGRNWFGYRASPSVVTYCALQAEAGIAGRMGTYGVHHGRDSENVRYVAQRFSLPFSRNERTEEPAQVTLIVLLLPSGAPSFRSAARSSACVVNARGDATLTR